VGIGPGGREEITPRAERALKGAEAVVGYSLYIDLLDGDLLTGKEVYRSGMHGEVERCRLAVDLARSGKRVAVVSGGDPGVYGMAGPVLEVLGDEELEVEIVPGVTAATAAAACLGAPLNHDFAVISLSDLLTPWPVIEKRLASAAHGDFITVLYNPKSQKRREHFRRAVAIFLEHRPPGTPAGVVKNAGRPGQASVVTDLERLLDLEADVDMLTTVIIGNSQTRVTGGRMVTPRGYVL